MKKYVLDTCALVAFFNDENGAAQAKVDKATIVSSDHHELDAVEKNTDIKFKWIR
jgi:PIN domain nuclease of toxin-antitoxin system